MDSYRARGVPFIQLCPHCTSGLRNAYTRPTSNKYNPGELLELCVASPEVKRPFTQAEEACPFCAEVGRAQGAPIIWVPYAKGRKLAPNEGYGHSIFKCRVGLAMLHAWVRHEHELRRSPPVAELFRDCRE